MIHSYLDELWNFGPWNAKPDLSQCWEYVRPVYDVNDFDVALGKEIKPLAGAAEGEEEKINEVAETAEEESDPLLASLNISSEEVPFLQASSSSPPIEEEQKIVSSSPEEESKADDTSLPNNEQEEEIDTTVPKKPSAPAPPRFPLEVMDQYIVDCLYHCLQRVPFMSLPL